MTDYAVGSRWLDICAGHAQAVRDLESQLAEARTKLDTSLLVARSWSNPTDLAAVTGLSRETIYKAMERASR